MWYVFFFLHTQDNTEALYSKAICLALRIPKDLNSDWHMETIGKILFGFPAGHRLGLI